MAEINERIKVLRERLGLTQTALAEKINRAPNTINQYYQQEVQHDMYGGGWHEKGIV